MRKAPSPRGRGRLEHRVRVRSLGARVWARGDIVAAHAGYTAAVEGLTRAGHIADVLGCSLTLADMELTLGRLGAAEDTLEHALDLAERHTPAGPG